MDVEHSPEEMLRLHVDEAVQAYADVLRAHLRGEHVDEQTDFRAQNVAIIACSVLVNIDKTKKWSAHFTDGLQSHGVNIERMRLTPAGWRKRQRLAFGSLRLSRNFRPDEVELLTDLLASDPRIELANPQRTQR